MGRKHRGEKSPCDVAFEQRSRFFVKVVASQTGSSIPRPTNQRKRRSNSIRSMSWRSEQIE